MIWKKYKETIIILIYLLLAGLVYFFVVDRLVAEIGNRKNKLREILAIQENEQKKMGNLTQVKKDFEKLEEAEKKIKPFLEEEKAVELIQEVEKMAEGTGNTVSIEVVSSEASAKGKTKEKAETIASVLPVKEYLQLKIKINGSFFSFLKLLNKLENSSYYLDIISLQISRNQNPEKEKVEEPTVRNPFEKDSPDEGEEVKTVQEEQIAALIDVVVYIKKK